MTRTSLIKPEQKKLAQALYELHHKDHLFIIPNIWNAGSALCFEKAGFEALATTSAGIAYALGYPDGEDINMDDLCLVVRQIAKRISLPISVDFERAYGQTAEEVQLNAQRLIASGAVGFNLEDGLADGGLEDIKTQVEKLKALVELKKSLDLNFVVNARTCAFWLKLGDEEQMLQMAIERGQAYAQAGADCFFVPGALSEYAISVLLKEIKIPLNIIANPVFNDFEKMSEMGVARLSIGSGAVRSVFNHLNEIAHDLKEYQIEKMTEHSFSYDMANAFFAK